MSSNRKVKFNQMCRICFCTGTSLYDLELSTHQEQSLAEIAETILSDKLVTGLNFNLPKYSCMRCIKGIIESKLLQEQLHKTNVLFQLLLNNGTLDSNHDTQYVTVEKSDIWETCVEPSCNLVWIRGTYRTYARKKVQKEIKIKSEPPEKCLQISDDFNTEEDSLEIVKNEIAKIEDDDFEECIYESNIECNSPDNSLFDLISDNKSEVLQDSVTVLKKSPENEGDLLKSPENDVVLQKSPESVAVLQNSPENVPVLQEFQENAPEGCILKINVNTDSDLELELDSDINELEEFELRTKRKKKRKLRRKTYMCTETGCGNETFGNAEFRDHNRRLHSQVYACSQCDKRFYSNAALKNHAQSHRYVTCEICQKRLKKHSLYSHMKWHAGDVRIKNRPPQKKKEKLFCQKCGSFFIRVNNHSCFGKSKIVERKHKCDLCDYKTISKGLLLRHRKRHTGEKPFLCNLCGYSCIQEVSLVAHQKLHRKLDKPLICHYFECEMSFTNRYEYRVHRKKHLPIYMSNDATKGKVYRKYRYASRITAKCDICGKGCTSQAAVDVHMRCHTNERPFKCTHCNNSFRQSHHLRSHLNLIHNNDDTANRYPCQICDKVLRSKLTLRDHIRIHTGDKLPCEHCERKFTHTSNLKKHCREVHGIRLVKRY